MPPAIDPPRSPPWHHQLSISSDPGSHGGSRRGGCSGLLAPDVLPFDLAGAGQLERRCVYSFSSSAPSLVEGGHAPVLDHDGWAFMLHGQRAPAMDGRLGKEGGCGAASRTWKGRRAWAAFSPLRFCSHECTVRRHDSNPAVAAAGAVWPHVLRRQPLERPLTARVKVMADYL